MTNNGSDMISHTSEKSKIEESKRRQIAHFARLERIFTNPSRTPSLELMCESYDDFGEAVEI